MTVRSHVGVRTGVQAVYQLGIDRLWVRTHKC
jgi:hypothetical protein